jgi:threonine dehydratase
MEWVAGADGCRGGWIVAFASASHNSIGISDILSVRVLTKFADIFAAPEQPRLVAVDIPIGLPGHIGPQGRGPERAVRPLLGARQSSVFAVPSRGAVYAPDFNAACRLALETSDPPKKVSKQLFMIAPKIREVDETLRNTPALIPHVFESILRSRSGVSMAAGRSSNRRRSRAARMSPASRCGGISSPSTDFPLP